MKLLRIFTPLLLASVIWCITGCGEDTTSSDDMPPSPPVWVERSPDNIYPQQGIRPEPVQGSTAYWVRLEWRANPEPDVDGYIIWRRNEFEGLGAITAVTDLRRNIDFTPSPILTYIDQGGTAERLQPDPDTGDSRGYYWYLQAYDESANRSELSLPQYYRLINNPFGLEVVREDSALYRMTWQFVPNPDVVISYYMLRVYSHHWGPDSVLWHVVEHEFGTQPTVYLNNDGAAGPFVRDCTYVWQLNVVADRHTSLHTDSLSGSAVYTTFVYHD